MKKAGTGKIRRIKEDTLIVTIDIGLEMNRRYCTATDGRDIKPFRFDNTRAGLDRLWSMIVVNKNRFRCDTYKGTVQLSGLVASQNAVDKAGQIAWSVKGVKSVKNDLIVK